MTRLFIVLAGVAWYVALRSVVYYYFLGSPMKDGKAEFFEWWWSWLIAIPASVLSAGLLIFITVGLIPWVFRGF